MEVTLAVHAKLTRFLVNDIYDQDWAGSMAVACLYSAPMEIACAYKLEGVPLGPKTWHTFDIYSQGQKYETTKHDEFWAFVLLQ